MVQSSSYLYEVMPPYVNAIKATINRLGRENLQPTEKWILDNAVEAYTDLSTRQHTAFFLKHEVEEMRAGDLPEGETAQRMAWFILHTDAPHIILSRAVERHLKHADLPPHVASELANWPESVRIHAERVRDTLQTHDHTAPAFSISEENQAALAEHMHDRYKVEVRENDGWLALIASVLERGRTFSAVG